MEGEGRVTNTINARKKRSAINKGRKSRFAQKCGRSCEGEAMTKQGKKKNHEKGKKKARNQETSRNSM